jgi:hypothetical protein
MDPANPLVTAITTAAATLQDQFGDVLGIALPVAATILAASIGWKVFRRFIKA